MRDRGEQDDADECLPALLRLLAVRCDTEPEAGRLLRVLLLRRFPVPAEAKRGIMSVSRTAVEDEFASPSECWCCGRVDDPTLMVHLGNHPEVALCRSCARDDLHSHGGPAKLRQQRRL